jgi:hypothetical protein
MAYDYDDFDDFGSDSDEVHRTPDAAQARAEGKLRELFESKKESVFFSR